jgi:alpha-glucoside transport system substrate-binding protein
MNAKKNTLWIALSVLLVAAFALSACAPAAAPTAPPPVVQTVVVTSPPEKIEVTKQVEVLVTPTIDVAKQGADTGTVFVMGAFRGEEENRFNEVIADFEKENPNIKVIYAGSSEFETLLPIRAEAGDPPDIAAVPQPGSMKKFASEGKIVPLWPEIVALIDKNYSPAWKDLGSYNGTPYGVFHRVNAKGWVWYNKPAFEKAGYKVPQTWDELTALTQEMQNSGIAPWCIGIESGAATGWVGTDWLENLMLRTQPVAKYDDWIAGKLKFDSPEVKNAWQVMDKIWADPKQVYGGMATIAATNFKDSAAGLFSDPPQCWLHLQGSFVTSFFPEAIQKDLDNQLGVFALPAVDASLPKALEVGGDQFIAFKDRPEIRKFMEFLATGSKSTASWIKAGGALFPHKDQDTSLYKSTIDQALVKAILEAQAARFDASDSMPSAANNAFWKAVADYTSGKSIDEVVKEVDAAFPQQ